jgi:dihydropteroate synthase
VLGILNVTPDSFSDGGRFAAVDLAISGLALVLAQGADLVDVGGESTRPGACGWTNEELDRVDPCRPRVVRGRRRGVRRHHAGPRRPGGLPPAPSSSTTSPAAWPTRTCWPSSPRLRPPVRAHALAGHSTVMQTRAVYDDVVREVCDELADRVDAALAAGVDPHDIVLDPGLGFAKDAEQTWSLLAACPR